MRQLGKRIFKSLAKYSVLVQRVYRWKIHNSPFYRLPNWKTLIPEKERLQFQLIAATAKPIKVLLGTSIGSHMNANIVDSVLSVALNLRGAEVHVLLCDGALPACFKCEIGLIRPGNFVEGGIKSYFCKGCTDSAEEMYRSLGIKVHKYSDFISEGMRVRVKNSLGEIKTLSDIGAFQFQGMPIGDHAKSGALRYFASSNLEGCEKGFQVALKYLEAALLTYFVSDALMKQEKYQVMSCLHGIYIPHGILNEVAKSHGIRVVNWTASYKKRSFLFSHGDTYHHTLMSEPVDTWQSIPWNEKIESEIMTYLNSRQQGGGRDWITFLKKPNQNLQEIQNSLKGIDFSKPCIGMLTNVAWDAQLHYPANAFPDMVDWVIKTIRYFLSRPDLQLILRIHPAEISGDIPSRQPILQEIAKHFPQLPSHIFIIPPDSDISTYAVMEKCQAVVIFGTKTGLELTSRGIPVIVAGEAWIKNKGLTFDAQTESAYFALLDQLPFKEKMDQATLTKARKYAFHFFYRRMIPTVTFSPTHAEPQYFVDIQSLDALKPGADPGLDVICQGILENTPFVFKAENQFV